MQQDTRTEKLMEIEADHFGLNYGKIVDSLKATLSSFRE